MHDNTGQQYLPGFWCRVARGFCAGAPHGLQVGFRCQVIYVLLLLLDVDEFKIIMVGRVQLGYPLCYSVGGLAGINV